MKKQRKHSYLYYDIMYPAWGIYHKWILHRGRYGFKESLIGCKHINPYNVLTPRRFKKQIKNIKKMEL